MRKLMSMMAVLGLLAAAAGAQDEKKKMEFPKPGKEHEALKKFEGRWDVVAKGMYEGKTEESKGTETVSGGYDGYWYGFNYSGMHGGKTFLGHGTMGYDPNKKKYLLTWIDNLSPYAFWAEGEADASGKTFTFTCDGFCPDLGKAATIKSVFEFQDDQHRTLTFFRDGKKMSTMSYTRQS